MQKGVKYLLERIGTEAGTIAQLLSEIEVLENRWSNKAELSKRLQELESKEDDPA